MSILEIFITPRRNPTPVSHLFTSFRQPILDFSCKWNHTIRGILWLASFPYCIMFLMFICIVAFKLTVAYKWSVSFTYFSCRLPLYHILYIHLSVEGHLTCFHFLAIILLLWTFMCKFLGGHVLISLGCRSRIARPYGNSIPQ